MNANMEIEAKVKELRELKAQIMALELQKKEIEEKIKAFMGDEENLLNVNAKKILVTWRNLTSKRIDSKKLKIEEPEIALKYSIEIFSRRFLVK